MVTQLLTLDEVAARLGCAVDGREPAGVWSATPACPVWAGTAVGRRAAGRVHYGRDRAGRRVLVPAGRGGRGRPRTS